MSALTRMIIFSHTTPGRSASGARGSRKPSRKRLPGRSWRNTRRWTSRTLRRSGEFTIFCTFSRQSADDCCIRRKWIYVRSGARPRLFLGTQLILSSFFLQYFVYCDAGFSERGESSLQGKTEYSQANFILLLSVLGVHIFRIVRVPSYSNLLYPEVDPFFIPYLRQRRVIGPWDATYLLNYLSVYLCLLVLLNSLSCSCSFRSAQYEFHTSYSWVFVQYTGFLGVHFHACVLKAKLVMIVKIETMQMNSSFMLPCWLVFPPPAFILLLLLRPCHPLPQNTSRLPRCSLP